MKFNRLSRIIFLFGIIIGSYSLLFDSFYFETMWICLIFSILNILYFKLFIKTDFILYDKEDPKFINYSLIIPIISFFYKSWFDFNINQSISFWISSFISGILFYVIIHFSNLKQIKKEGVKNVILLELLLYFVYFSSAIIFLNCKLDSTKTKYFISEIKNKNEGFTRSLGHTYTIELTNSPIHINEINVSDYYFKNLNLKNDIKIPYKKGLFGYCWIPINPKL